MIIIPPDQLPVAARKLGEKLVACRIRLTKKPNVVSFLTDLTRMLVVHQQPVILSPLETDGSPKIRFVRPMDGLAFLGREVDRFFGPGHSVAILVLNHNGQLFRRGRMVHHPKSKKENDLATLMLAIALLAGGADTGNPDSIYGDALCCLDHQLNLH